MSYIGDKVVYVIINEVDLTEEMLNIMKKDFNVTGGVSTHSLRKSKDGTQVVLKVKDLLSTVFNNYRWYSQDEILDKMSEPEWATDPP